MRPWLERNGRVSPLKSLVFAALFLPGLWIVTLYVTGGLGARPMDEAIHQAGLWTIRWLFITLAITPGRHVLRWPRLVLVRRMIGIAAFAYGLGHITLYAADEAFDLAKVASEIASRIYLAIGLAALLGLTALAITSTDGMTRRLGGRNWQRLHRLAYVIGALALVHFFMQSKLDLAEPTVMAGLYGWLMGCRVIVRLRKDRGIPLPAVALLGLVAGLATALGEAAYFRLAMGVDPLRMLGADLSLATGLRPAWYVLAIGLAAALAGALRALRRRITTRAPGLAYR